MTVSDVLAFENLYLEDSYFLGLITEGRRLRLRVLFVLTIDHPLYVSPKTGEAHCYREGDILIDGLRIVEWQNQNGSILSDPDGTFDLGSIEFTQEGQAYHLATEWFDMRFYADSISVALDANGGET